MTLRTRISALEAANPGDARPWHWLIKKPGQAMEEAITAFGLEKVDPNDNFIVWTIVDPTGRAA